MHNKNLIIIIPLFIIFFAIIISSFQKRVSSPIDNPNTIERKDVYLGAWVGGFWDNDNRTLNVDSLKKFEQDIDKKLAIANIFTDWKYISNPLYLEDLNNISQNGWVPMISTNPSFFDGCPDEKDGSLYKTIANGRCDGHLKDIANNLRVYDKPVFLRFAWEMNLPDMYWSISALNSTPSEFIEAWRRFHSILKRENTKNVIWVLSFNTSSGKTIPYKELYPGDEYVDWVAIDGYNWGDSADWSNWTSFNGVFRNSYNELRSVSDKPIMLSEVNSSPSGGDKAKWIKDMLDEEIPNNFSKVEAIVFFNENKFEGESVDWRMEKSPEYLKVLRESLNNKIYKSKFP